MNADVYVNIMRQEIKSRYVRAPYSNFPDVAAIVEVALGGKIDKIEMLRSKIVDVATSMRDNSGDGKLQCTLVSLREVVFTFQSAAITVCRRRAGALCSKSRFLRRISILGSLLLI